jgi:bifunctional UDP-N-acetylglucosamine pyrophosphorylase/glucosamine-1-phosphate N-acetyltransferase
MQLRPNATMFSAVFEQPTCIDDEARLRKLFGTDRLSLEGSASVVFEGAISLGSDIVFSGYCRLGGGASVENGCILTNVDLGSGNKVRPYSILSNVKAGSRNLFGPFCFIRDECIVGDDCILGSHVETARSVFASGVKISHHAFVGDANVGERTIIGAGVVFCNYDGLKRQVTRVGSNVILGSGVLLVAPVSIGDDSLVAAGSTVTKDVPSGSKIIQRHR